MDCWHTFLKAGSPKQMYHDIRKRMSIVYFYVSYAERLVFVRRSLPF